MMDERVLIVGEWRLDLRPDLGGAITALRFQSRDILRPAPKGTDQILEAGCFPLVPWCNRIAGARFVWAGREIAMAPTPGFEPHALHGHGWRMPWSVVGADDNSVTLGLERAGDADWPWSWTARQRFTLGSEGLEVMLSVTNGSDTTMPAGLGLHPYFVRTAASALTLASTGVWMVDGTLTPTTLEAPQAVADWSGGETVGSDRFVDNCYAGWDGVATIYGEDDRIVLSASANARWAHVFTPVGAEFFCVEPVTHRPNGVNAPKGEDAGVVALDPGQTLSVTMRIGRG